MTETTHWPVASQPLAIDPYPWHGLVYRLRSGGGELLDPLDGRPVIPLPPFNDNAAPRLHPYIQAAGGFLWDIGRADPPVTPVLQAAGAQSLGRRIVRPVPGSQALPARLGDKTRRVNVLQQPAGNSQRIRLYLSVDGVTQAPFCDLGFADFGADPANIYREDSPAPITDAGQFGLSPSLCDVSPDGCRRLYLVRMFREFGEGVSPFEVPVVGVLEVQLALVSGSVVATAQVLHTASQCLGTYSNSGSADMQWRRSRSFGWGEDNEGGQCGSQNVWETAQPGDPLNAGSVSRTSTRSGVVLGAIYSGGSVELLTCTVTMAYSVSQTWEQADWLGINVNGTCIRPELQPDIFEVWAYHRRHRFDFQLMGNTLTTEFQVQSWRNSRTYWVTPTDTEREVSEGSTYTVGDLVADTPYVEAGRFLHWPYTEPPPPGLTMPYIGTFYDYWSRAFGLVTAPLGQRACWAGATTQPLNVIFSGQPVVSPILHPGGVTGSWMPDPNAPPGEVYYPTVAVNPITGHAVRGVDHPDRIILGYL